MQISLVYQMALCTSSRSLSLVVCLIASSVGLVYSSDSDRYLLPYEPVQYLKAQLPAAVSSPLSELLLEATPSGAAEFITKAKEHLKTHLAKSGTSVVLVRGERVMVQRRSTGLKWDSKIELPPSNTLSLVSVVLPILLENYKSSIINNPIGQVLKGDDLKHPLISGRESMSFLDVLCKLPHTGKTVDLDSTAQLRSLVANGELSLHFLNSVLEKISKEAWMDALMALGSTDVTRSESGQLVMDLNSLLQFSLTVIHDVKMMGKAPRKEKLPLDDGKYLFGWWFNCPKSTDSKPDTAKCLLPSAPPDTIFTLSPELRMYVTPSLELTVIITGPGASSSTRSGSFKAGKKLDSVADILVEDEEIWKQFQSSIVNPEAEAIPQSEVPSEPDTDHTVKTDEENRDDEDKDNEPNMKATLDVDNENADLIKLIHQVWPIINFLFWVTASHVWVYWLLHGFWFIMTSVSKRAHIPRPKTAAGQTD